MSKKIYENDTTVQLSGFSYIIKLNRHICGKHDQLQHKTSKIERLTFREISDRLAHVLEATHDVAQTGRGPEILLLKTEFLSNWRVCQAILINSMSKYSPIVLSLGYRTAVMFSAEFDD